ncbi:hypothetical protein BGZ97_013079 [Linnemannia gamsii]|uniref:Uncharacterized protein n=1 Tax=Linnemannia gamsii TaxID=64522 RepID=A0A9P6UL46_9FUNG|nr:hypothetical protein BGZ97_013079 [Linnemannia gamsii]
MNPTTILLLTLACALATHAAPIIPENAAVASTSLAQDLTPSTKSWEGAASESAGVLENNPWDKRDMGWQSTPANPQEVKNNPWDKRDMGQNANVASEAKEAKNDPWDVVQPGSTGWDKRDDGDYSAEVDTNPWDKRGDDAVKENAGIWGKRGDDSVENSDILYWG